VGQFQVAKINLPHLAKKLSAVIILLGLAGVAGFLLPSSVRVLIHWTDAVLSILFAVLSWLLLQLVVPQRYFYFSKWRKLQLVIVPLIWVLLITALAICLTRIQTQWPVPLDDII
jgi:hypothetical protein